MLTIPPLLDERTIEAIRAKAQRNKTYSARTGKHPYLLGGLIYCDACGYTMNGQTNHNGHRYYRHGNRDGARLCELHPRPWVRADEIEIAVLSHLLEFYGNPVAVQKAIEDATPNLGKLKEQQERLDRIEVDLAKVKAGKERLAAMIVRGTINEDDAEKAITEANERQVKLLTDRNLIQDQMENLPTPEAIASAAHRFVDRLGRQRHYSDAKLISEKRRLVRLEQLSWAEKRELIQNVFSVNNRRRTKPMGVYIETIDSQANHRHKSWCFKFIGDVTIDEHIGTSASVAESTWL